MTDCKREESWESAKRRKAMNGFSGSILEDDELGADVLFLALEDESEEDAMVCRTNGSWALAMRLSCAATGDRMLCDASTPSAKGR
jgi:hypothetical protein